MVSGPAPWPFALSSLPISKHMSFILPDAGRLSSDRKRVWLFDRDEPVSWGASKLWVGPTPEVLAEEVRAAVSDWLEFPRLTTDTTISSPPPGVIASVLRECSEHGVASWHAVESSVRA